jgi:glycosyltransferase involved in cell wall biosynthesis
MPQFHPTDRSIFKATVSLVLPVFNEVQVLDRLTNAICRVMDEQHCRYEIVFVNDGSRDGSEELLDELAGRNEHVRSVH